MRGALLRLDRYESRTVSGEGPENNMNRVAVPIPEKLFFKIGEVCDITGVQAHVLRYWESEFPMLAPQKNRAGQRTYRKRDVEMALRIKELLYEDQYTIAGAKKKLASELRGASKLKVVTPEMNAAAAPSATEALSPLPAPSTAQPNISPPVAAPPRASFNETAATETSAPLSGERADERRAAVRRLKTELRELLALLDASEAQPDARRK